MPATLHAPCLEPGIAPSTVGSISGSSLADYVQFFDLDLTVLRGRDVLDVAAGAAAFTAEACILKIYAVAVDARYGCGVDELATQLQMDCARATARPRMGWQVGRGRKPSRDDAAECEGRAAAQRFLGDYENNFVNNRYVAGSLPRLPFFDETFDLVLRRTAP